MGRAREGDGEEEGEREREGREGGREGREEMESVSLSRRVRVFLNTT